MENQTVVQGELFPELGVAQEQPKKKSSIDVLREKKRKLQEENKAYLLKIEELQKENASLKAKAEAFDELMQSKSLFPIGVIAKNFGYSAVWMNQYLKEKKVQFCRADVWYLYAKYQHCGYTQHCWYNYAKDSKGNPLSRAHMYWTGKGINFIRDLLKKDGKIKD